MNRKLKYAVYLKGSLQKSVDGLETWYKSWDPSWYLITRLALPEIDAELRQQKRDEDSQKLQPLRIMGGLREARRENTDTNCRRFGFLPETVTFYLARQVNHSTAVISARSDSHALVILDNIEYRPETSEVDISNDIQKLARLLSALDPVTCNLLRCEGVKRSVDRTGRLKGFSLIFQMPPTIAGPSESLATSQTKIRSLRESLLDQSITISLSYRLAIAKSLARAVIFIHSASFVHKNIRPETVLATKSGDSFLIGFERFRAAASHTYMFGDNLWHQNLYRHPARQGLAPEEMYTMQHDVYSLGVLLLEIGLWTSFVHYAIGPIGEALVLPGSLELAAVPKMRDERKRAFELKRTMTELAREKLPSQMGDRYTSLVVSCLTYLDKDSSFAGYDVGSGDDEGLVMGAEYIRKVRGGCLRSCMTSANLPRSYSRWKEFRYDEQGLINQFWSGQTSISWLHDL